MVLEQLIDIYVGATLESLCNAIVYVFAASEPSHLLALRFRLACNYRLL
jgi:hypothetical protein